MSEIRLLIVEDEAIIAEDIAELCEILGYQVIDTAHTAGRALLTLKEKEVDLVLLDINLEDDIDGIEIAEYIVKELQIPFIYLTSYADMETITRAKRTHPMGYIVKPFNKEQLLSTIEISLYNHAESQVPGGFTLEEINGQLLNKLTEKEFDILQHIYNGKTNKQIAGLEYLSVNTIKYHIKQLYLKLNVNSRSTLLAEIRRLTSLAKS